MELRGLPGIVTTIERRIARFPAKLIEWVRAELEVFMKSNYVKLRFQNNASLA